MPLAAGFHFQGHFQHSCIDFKRLPFPSQQRFLKLLPITGPSWGLAIESNVGSDLFPTGLPTYLVVVATGLNQSKLQAVNLEGRTGSLGLLRLQEGAGGTNLFVAELPQELLAHSNFSVVLQAVDGEGRKVERAASQVATTMGSLLEVSWQRKLGAPLSVLRLCAWPPLPPPAVLCGGSHLESSDAVQGSVINTLVCSS